MSLDYVKSGDSLTAANENKKIAAINNITDRLDTLHISSNGSKGIICTVKNTTSSTVETGGVLAVSGLRTTGLKDKLKSLYKNSGIQLTGTSVTTTSTLLCFALESIQEDKIGKCYIPDVIGAEILVKDDAHGYAKPKADGLESCAYGPFKIIGKSTRPTNISSDSDYEGFAIISVNGMKGHIIGSTQSEVNGTGHSDITVGNITIPNIGCPLLRNGEKISAGSTVVLSWNEIDNELQIIEAQCEPEEEE